MCTPLLPEVVLGGANRNGDWPQECGWYGPGYYGYGMGCDTGDVKLAEGCSNDSEGRSAKLGKTGRKRAKKAPIVVNEESDGFAGLAENVVAPQGSVQELTGLGRNKIHGIASGAQCWGTPQLLPRGLLIRMEFGNRGKSPVNPEAVVVSVSGFSAVLSRSKTIGAVKSVVSRSLTIATCCHLSELAWMRTGFTLLQQLAPFPPDYLLPAPASSLTGALTKEMRYETGYGLQSRVLFRANNCKMRASQP